MLLATAGVGFGFAAGLQAEPAGVGSAPKFAKPCKA